ncbi:MAG: helix-turn-helix domain-containing protein [Clostridiales bacterium]|jgi:transcriptional regulator with XRE-family HTH domain|nr:helix-turn-helix domain-containing protein [Clostridiales bacterium]
MFKNKNQSRNNICGERIAELRGTLLPYISQRALAEKLQLQGLDLDKNAVQRIESGQRFVTDIELLAFSNIFKITADELLRTPDLKKDN